MLLTADRIWRKSIKLWGLLQNLKIKEFGRISVQLLVKYKLNAKAFSNEKKMRIKCN